jgi:hypothetical protein
MKTHNQISTFPPLLSPSCAKCGENTGKYGIMQDMIRHNEQLLTFFEEVCIETVAAADCTSLSVLFGLKASFGLLKQKAAQASTICRDPTCPGQNSNKALHHLILNEKMEERQAEKKLATSQQWISKSEDAKAYHIKHDAVLKPISGRKRKCPYQAIGIMNDKPQRNLESGEKDKFENLFAETTEVLNMGSTPSTGGGEEEEEEIFGPTVALIAIDITNKFALIGQQIRLKKCGWCEATREKLLDEGFEGEMEQESEEQIEDI